MKANIFLLAALLGTSMTYAQRSSKTTYRTENHISNDHTSISTDRNGVQYEIELVKDKLTALSVDGKEVPAAEWSKYDAVIKEINDQIKKDRMQAEIDRKQADKDRIQADKDRVRAELDRQQAIRDREQAGRDRAQAEKDRAQTVIDHAQADKDREQAVRDRERADKDREQAVRDRAQADKDREQAAKDRIQADKDRAQAAEDRKQMKAMISDMVTDKIISEESALETVSITDDGMKVNGKKQDDEVFKKYRTKYSRFAGNNFYYNRSGGRIHMGTSVN